ncbi:MAG TPA: YjhX family toxin [Caulobacteraceae bacterium]|jgi:hypothetical protein
MNISRAEQRTLHALAQGGAILLERDPDGRIVKAECMTRDGWVLTDCGVSTWRRLKTRRLVASQEGGPYRITREGLARLRSQLDNRVSARRW